MNKENCELPRLTDEQIEDIILFLDLYKQGVVTRMELQNRIWESFNANKWMSTFGNVKTIKIGSNC